MRPDQSPTPVSKMEYSPEDLKKWKEGALSYKEFLNSDGVQDYLWYIEHGQLEALFLKEKPAIFFGPQNMDVFKSSLPSFGFKVTGEYVYDTGQVQSVINDNQEIFTQYGSTDADEIMEKLSKDKNTSAHIVRGLILGFPLKAVEYFEKRGKYKINEIILKLYKLLETDPIKYEFLLSNFDSEKCEGNIEIFNFILEEIQSHLQELEITQNEIPELTSQLKEIIDAKLINVYGNAWSQYGDDPESQKKQLRLKNAFENSGILNLG